MCPILYVDNAPDKILEINFPKRTLTTSYYNYCNNNLTCVFVVLCIQLIDLLDHDTLGNPAAIAFRNISMDVPTVHLPNVKFLFKQKLFHIMLTKLTDRLSEFSVNHTVAMAYVLEQVPHQVLKINLEKVYSERNLQKYYICNSRILFVCTGRSDTVQMHKVEYHNIGADCTEHHQRIFRRRKSLFSRSLSTLYGQLH